MKNSLLKIILLLAALWLPLNAHAAKNILMFGDSLSAGYGIAVAESWPALPQQEPARNGSKPSGSPLDITPDELFQSKLHQLIRSAQEPK